MSRLDRAILALREAADALDDCPVRKPHLIQQLNNSTSMREEADWLQGVANAVKDEVRPQVEEQVRQEVERERTGPDPIPVDGGGRTP